MIKNFILATGLLFCSIFGFAQGGGQFGGGSSLPTSAQVVAAFSSCSGTQYLGADGACHTAGIGTVSANNGSAGALATFAAAGGSTTVGPDAGLNSNGTGTLTAGAVGLGNGAFAVNGTTSGTIQWTCSANNCTTWSTASPVQSTSNSGFIMKHLQQVAANNFAGSCAMSAATTCTATINATYTTPICFASVQAAAPTTFQGSCALSGTTVTITASASNSNTWAYVVMGNPN